MGAKKSNPDAKAAGVVPVGHAVNFSGKSSQSEIKVTRMHEAVNSGGKSKGGIHIDGTHDIKTDVSIPSVGAMKSKVAKQLKENDKINKKNRGD